MNLIDTEEHWYVMRTTYGREKKAYEYVTEHGGVAFYPTIQEIKSKNDRKIKIEVSRFPNIFFIRGTEEDVKTYAYDNVHLPFLRFYYGHKHEGINIVKYPLIVPDNQMDSLQILCNSSSMDTIVVPSTVTNFQKGDLVQVIDGEFKGIEGRASRWHGQQRVAIIIEGLCTIATAYVPSAFLRKI